MDNAPFNSEAFNSATLPMAATERKTRSDNLLSRLKDRSARRAKIVCTLGPASSSEVMIRKLLGAGMDVARLNFSHGTHEDHAERIGLLRKIAQEEGRTVCILQDLQGPKIRTGRLRDRRPVLLVAGFHLVITPRDLLGTPELISTSFPDLAQDVAPGARILLSDGLIELRVVAIRGADVECEIINGGLLGEHQGINIPGTALSVPSLTAKDSEDLAFGMRYQVDAIALSFVRSAADIREARRLIAGGSCEIPLIAKLEKPQAIDNLEEILEIADGVMVARGDLGVEMPPEQVPIIQKHIVRRASDWRKPVIIATQMLESMVENPRPTRAEASDVANAILDGTDAVMHSAETATGKYPRQAVEMMARISIEAEAHLRVHHVMRRRERRRLTISEAICESVASVAQELKMRAICVYTETGTTARVVSKYRPAAPIFGFAFLPAVANRINLYWGVQPILCGHVHTAEEMVRNAEQELLRGGIVSAGDIIGVISGTTWGGAGSTNLMRLHVVGEFDSGGPALDACGPPVTSGNC
jgi:pyruvate kinase